MVVFNGSIKLKICEAVDLRPTDFSTRFMPSAKNLQLISPYISVYIDDKPTARTTTKPKTFKPVWNEDLQIDIHDGTTVGLTVFHDAATTDDFVANCTLALDEVVGKPLHDVWVRLISKLRKK